MGPQPCVELTPRHSKNVLSFKQKVKFPNKLKEGISYAAVGKLFSVNESTVCYIEKTETRSVR